MCIYVSSYRELFTFYTALSIVSSLPSRTPNKDLYLRLFCERLRKFQLIKNTHRSRMYCYCALYCAQIFVIRYLVYKGFQALFRPPPLSLSLLLIRPSSFREKVFRKARANTTSESLSILSLTVNNRKRALRMSERCLQGFTTEIREWDTIRAEIPTTARKHRDRWWYQLLVISQQKDVKKYFNIKWC